MDFYDEYSDEISRNFITLDPTTSDMIQQDNSNTSFLISHLNEYISLSYIPSILMDKFNKYIIQRVIWENIIIDGIPNSRLTFNMDGHDENFEKNVPFDYFKIYENDSIIDACIELLYKYLYEKYKNFDFLLVNDIIDRMEHFQKFDYLLRIFNMFETLLPLMIKTQHESLLNIFGDISLIEKLNKAKEKSSIAIIWDQCLNYLNKCDPDIYYIFNNQSWVFISNYVIKNI